MSDKVYIVYQHVNKINNKQYIGITCMKFEYRCGPNGNRYRECPHFWNAIQKYGWDNFEHNILYSGLSHDEACAMERELIAKFKTNDPQYGYNISPGGDGFTSEFMKQRWQNQEIRDEMTSAMIEAWKDPEKRKRRSEAAKERWANPEFKQFAMPRAINGCARAVRCIETGQVFNVLKEAATYYGIHSGNIIYACKHGGRCCGLHWEYV